MIDNRCGRLNCICTHNDGCERGWIHGKNYVTTQTQTRDGTIKESVISYDAVQPCRTCDPERAYIFEKAKSSNELGELLRNRSNAKKQAAYEEQENKRTRTL